MTNKSTFFVMRSLLLLAALGIAASGCSPHIIGSSVPVRANLIAAALAISPASKTLVVGNSFAFSASGGSGSYTYSIVSGGGSVNSANGLFTAPNTAQTVILRVTDSATATSDATITVATEVSASQAAASISMPAITSYTISGAGGVPPYSYSVISGNGSVDSSTGVFTPVFPPGSATVRITDSLGNSTNSTLTSYRISTDRPVRAIVKSGNSIYIGGDFTAVNPIHAPKMIKLNPANGDAILKCELLSGFNGIVNALALSGNSIYVGGNFTTYQGQPANYLAKLNASTCTLDTTFSPPANNGFNGNVNALAVSGAYLYAGGVFTSYKGVNGSAKYIAKLSLENGTLDTTFNPPANNGFNGKVNALAVSGAYLHVGGGFLSYRGVANSAKYIAKLSLDDGTLDTTFSPPANNGFNGNVNALAVSGAYLYVGGDFTSYKGVAGSAKYIAKLSLDNATLDTTFSPPANNGFNSKVNALAVSGAYLYVGGGFLSYREVANSAKYIAKLSLDDGTLDTTFSPPANNGFDCDVNALAVSGLSLYAGGWFTYYKASSAKRIAKLSLENGELDTTFNPSTGNGFNYEVFALAVSESSLYAGGSFSTYKGQLANHVAKLDATTYTLDTLFSPPASNGFNDQVSALAISGDYLYVGGDFTSYKGVTGSAKFIAKLSLDDGTLDTTFSPPANNGFNSYTDSLVASGSYLYVGGGFTTYRGTNPVNRIAKLSLDSGALDTTFSPPANNGFDFFVNTLAVSGAYLYVGGTFNSYRGVANSANYIAKLSLEDGTLDTTFSPPANNGFDFFVNTLAVSGAYLYVGGMFNNYRGVANSANYIAKLSLEDGTLDTTFSPPANNGFDYDVDAIAVSGSSLYAGGWFNSYRGTNSAYYIAKLSLEDGTLDTTFSSPTINSFNYNVYALAVSDSCLYAGGEFERYRDHTVIGFTPLDLTTGDLK